MEESQQNNMEHPDVRGLVFRELISVFSSHNLPGGLALEILAEMMVQTLKGMQILDSSNMEDYALPFLDQIKKKVSELMPLIRQQREQSHFHSE